MTKPTALVVGPNGAIGATLVKECASRGIDVFGLNRSGPHGDLPYRPCVADLDDLGSVSSALAAVPAIDLVFYAARAPHGEGGFENVEGNLRMLVNVVSAVERQAGSALRHVHLVEGTKWYGLHLGPYRTPAREDDPRHMPPNFYYDQQDALTAMQAGKDWHWSATRPNVVCDFAPRRARNLTSIIGVYAAICRELRVPFDFPGTEEGFRTLTEVTDGPHLARGILWLATEATDVDRAYNFTNGDAFRWSLMWPAAARRFGLECGIARNFRLGAWMADKEPVWRRITERHGLMASSLSDLALWDFADFVFRQDWDVISDLTRLRRAGFGEAVDTYEMFDRQWTLYERARLLPRP
jgi:nucleoside-diphosphate-sugar epimerase